MLQLRLTLAGPCAHAAEPQLPAAIRVITLAEAGDTPDTRLRLYELVREGVIDDPSNDGSFMGAEEFSANLFEPYYWQFADCQFIAVLDDEWVALCNLQPWPQAARFGVTVVKRAHRRRGIAQALKVRALNYLRQAGVPEVTTANHQTNEAVLALNRSLGFVVD